MDYKRLLSDATSQALSACHVPGPLRSGVSCEKLAHIAKELIVPHMNTSPRILLIFWMMSFPKLYFVVQLLVMGELSNIRGICCHLNVQ